MNEENTNKKNQRMSKIKIKGNEWMIKRKIEWLIKYYDRNSNEEINDKWWKSNERITDNERIAYKNKFSEKQRIN